MVKVNYSLWKHSFPFICTECDHLLHEKREMCEHCGKKGTLRGITKKDYKRKFKKVREL